MFGMKCAADHYLMSEIEILYAYSLTETQTVQK